MPDLITLTQPSPSQSTYILTLSAPPDNRLTPPFLACLSRRLDEIELDWRRRRRVPASSESRSGTSQDSKGGTGGHGGAVVLTSNCGRFFSNGLDYENSVKDPVFFEDTFDPVIYRLLTFPLVTVAAINGHGGLVLALACDYRVMTSGKGLLCMNEIAFGASFPNSFSALFRLRLPHSSHLRDTIMGRRWTQAEALQIGLLDEVVDDAGKPEVLISRAVEVAEREGAKVGGGSWGLIKDAVYHTVIDASRSRRPVTLPVHDAKRFWDRVEKDNAKL